MTPKKIVWVIVGIGLVLAGAAYFLKADEPVMPPTAADLAPYFAEQLTDPSVLLPEDREGVPPGPLSDEGYTVVLENVSQRLGVELKGESSVDAIVALLNNNQ